MKNIDIILWLKCNLNCIFCETENSIWFESSLMKYLSAISDFQKKGFDGITFSWWEPTLDKNLETYIKFAKKIWFNNIAIQTNLTCSPEYLRKLINIWITKIWLTYFWKTEEIFDKITCSDKQYSNYKTNLDNLQIIKKDIDITLDLVLNDEFLADIKSILNEIKSFSFQNVNIKFPLPIWKQVLDCDIKEYTDVLIWNLKCIENFNYKILYFPTCHLEWLENKIYSFWNDHIFDWKYTFSLQESIDKNFPKPDDCNACKLSSSCYWYIKINNIKN